MKMLTLIGNQVKTMTSQYCDIATPNSVFPAGLTQARLRYARVSKMSQWSIEKWLLALSLDTAVYIYFGIEEYQEVISEQAFKLLAAKQDVLGTGLIDMAVPIRIHLLAQILRNAHCDPSTVSLKLRGYFWKGC
jgi:hypothetical protein